MECFSSFPLYIFSLPQPASKYFLDLQIYCNNYKNMCLNSSLSLLMLLLCILFLHMFKIPRILLLYFFYSQLYFRVTKIKMYIIFTFILIICTIFYCFAYMCLLKLLSDIFLMPGGLALTFFSGNEFIH